MMFKNSGQQCLGLMVILTTISPIQLYNLEPQMPLFRSGPADSLFGFSMVMHRTTTDDSVGLEGTLLVVGAPNASAIETPGSRTDVDGKATGGIYYCPLTGVGDCKRVSMDKGGNEVKSDSTANVTHKKEGQWLGASLKSQGPGKYLITCAHKSTVDIIPAHNWKDEKQILCGKCFLLKAEGNRIKEVTPGGPEYPDGFVSNTCSGFTVPEPMHKNNYGYNQAGASIATLGDEYVLGAPGTWAWTGALFDFEAPGEPLVQTPSCINVKPTFRYKNKYGATHCTKYPLERNSYIGISVAMGNAVEASSQRIYYAAGSPRGNLTGAVVLFRKEVQNGKQMLVPDNSRTVYGENVGSSFGYSVELLDVTGDGRDDLIVGAPQYFEYTTKDTRGGAIYVYINSPVRVFRYVEPMRFYGTPDSFFGHSITSLGDLDLDGYNDFAVGAPYAEGSGAVYIFRGGRNGPEISQILKGSATGSMGEQMVGFGASVAGGVDADGNRYPDLVVGSFSNSIALIRTRPVVTVLAELNGLPEEFDLERKTCRYQGKLYACFQLSYCFKYYGRMVNYTEGISVKYTLKLDHLQLQKRGKPRLHFGSPDGKSVVKSYVTLGEEGVRFCPGETNNIYFHGGSDDKLTAIEITFDFDLSLPEFSDSAMIDMSEMPVLDKDVGNQKSSVINIKNTCGDDGCQSDLKIDATLPDEVKIGADSTTEMEIRVSNEGEEAHQAQVEVFLPSDVFLSSSSHIGNSTDISCFPAYIGEISFVKCDLGNPYLSGMKDRIFLTLSTQTLDYHKKQIQVRVEGRTTSMNPKIPPIALQSQVIVELSLSVSGSSRPEQIMYTKEGTLGESGIKTPDEIGPKLEYSFIVKNTESQPAYGAILEVELPIEIDNGKWLLYLVSAEVTAGGNVPAGKCDSEYINILNLNIDFTSGDRKRRSTKNFRRVPVAQAISGGKGYVSSFPLACERKNVRCKNIKCMIGEIAPEATVSVTLHMHIWEATFVEEYNDFDLVSITTKARLIGEEHHTRFIGNQLNSEVRTIIDHEISDSEIGDAFPWWILMLGVVLLLIIYIVATILLIKCGFFRRKRFPRHKDEYGHLVLEEKRGEAKL